MWDQALTRMPWQPGKQGTLPTQAIRIPQACPVPSYQEGQFLVCFIHSKDALGALKSLIVCKSISAEGLQAVHCTYTHTLSLLPCAICIQLQCRCPNQPANLTKCWQHVSAAASESSSDASVADVQLPACHQIACCAPEPGPTAKLLSSVQNSQQTAGEGADAMPFVLQPE